MINLKKINKKMQWNIFCGILLLIFAFFVMYNSDNKVISQEESSSTNQVETTTKNTETKKVTEEITTKASDTKKTTSKKKLKKLIDFDAEFPYLIRVNRAENFAIVYGMDKKGHHSIPYKAFICSTGLEEGDTPLGVFEMSDKYRWRLMVDNTYAQYAIRIHGQIMLHSVPYVEPSSDTLESWEYNKLGKPASLGCIRFRVSAIKWIYNNCPEGTKVNVYSKPGEIPPIEIPKIKKIKKSNPKSGWDPTDPVKGNPWKKHKTKKNSKKYKTEFETTSSDITEQYTAELNN